MPRDDIVVEVVEALAETDGLEPTELDYSLPDHMDPEVLEKLDEMEDGIWELVFRVSDHQVRLTHENQIFIDGVKHSPNAPEQE